MYRVDWLFHDVQPHPFKTDIFGSMHVVERGLRVWPAPNVKIKQRQKCFRDTHLIRTPCTGAPEDHFLYYICSEKQKLPRIFYSLRKAKNF